LDDYNNNRCGDSCVIISGGAFCSVVRNCPEGYKKQDKENGVCCPSTDNILNTWGILSCLLHKEDCKPDQTFCEGEQLSKGKANKCCDPGTTCQHDTDGYPRCTKADGTVDPYPWKQ
jgi:hypothetical protein